MIDLYGAVVPPPNNDEAWARAVELAGGAKQKAERKKLQAEALTEATKAKRPYDEDSLTCMWSSGKSVAAILMLMMEDRGHLKYDEAIASYWPEFAKHQKEKIKVEDVLRHESGLSNLKQRINVKFTSTEHIKKNKIGEVIEDEHVEFPFGC